MDGPPAPTYTFGDFRLDTGKRLLLDQDGQTIPLMPKAFDTLRHLVENAGITIEKDALMSAVWPDTIVEENNLSQNISLLRKALRERPGDNRYIVTVPGRGFKFVGDVRKETAEQPVDTRPDPRVEVPRPGWSSRRIAIVAIGAAVVIAVVALAYSYFADRRSIDSIAVMPFVNESGDPELEYLSDGMTHALIDNLSRLQRLTVKPGSTVFRYKGKSIEAAAIGKELGVGAVLFGRVTRRGDDLTLRVELVDTQTENNLWSQTFNRKVTNLVALEGDLVGNLVRRLSLRLSGTGELARKNTENAEAYQLYLNGQFHFRKLSPPAISKGITLLEQAITLDPSYALAYATLARAHIALALAAEAEPSELLKAKTAAQAAVRLDPGLAEAHSALAAALALHDWNWAEAENQFNLALELDPNSAPTHQSYGDFLIRMGRREQAAEQLERARELEPFSPFINTFAAMTQTDDDAALQRLRFAIDLDPNFYLAHMVASQIYRRKKLYAEAIEEARLAKQLSPGQTHSDVVLAYSLVDSGKPEEARAILIELLRISKTRFVPPVNIASVHDALGETDQALAMLEKGYEIRDPRVTFLKIAPVSNDLRQNPRFQDLLRRVGF